MTRAGDALPSVAAVGIPAALFCESAGLSGRFVLLADGECLGATREQLRCAARNAVLLNVNGYLDDEELLNAACLRGSWTSTRVSRSSGSNMDCTTRSAGHDAFVTVGERIGEPDCLIPTGVDHDATACLPSCMARRPPVVTDRITTVATWRGPFAPIEHDGVRLALRVHEFRRFVARAELVDVHFELGRLDIDPADAADDQ